MGSCCVAGLGLVWYCYCIYMTFVCLSQKKWIYFGYLRGLGCVESKNKTSAKRKSTMSSLNPSIIQVDSFKCRAGYPVHFFITMSQKRGDEDGGKDGDLAHRTAQHLRRQGRSVLQFSKYFEKNIN